MALFRPTKCMALFRATKVCMDGTKCMLESVKRHVGRHGGHGFAPSWRSFRISSLRCTEELDTCYRLMFLFSVLFVAAAKGAKNVATASTGFCGPTVDEVGDCDSGNSGS